ncbi:MAG: response regulator [Pseudomonadota bacterium]
MSRKGRNGLSGRILVVEDNTRADAALSVLCQLYGAETRTAASAAEAARVAADFRPDAVLVDVSALNAEACKAARRIRSALQDALLIAVSEWKGQRDATSPAAAGFDARLFKPVEADALASLLDELRARG